MHVRNWTAVYFGWFIVGTLTMHAQVGWHSIDHVRVEEHPAEGPVAKAIWHARPNLET